MIRRLFAFLLILALAGGLPARPPVKFDRYFLDKTMRLDYFHVGDAKEEIITLDRVFEEGVWAGSRKNLLDPFNSGRYSVKVYDSQTEDLVFSRSFDSYFGEYKTTTEALKGVRRTYHESALIPFPKDKIRFTVETRNRDNSFRPIFSQEIDPASHFVSREKRASGVQVIEVLKNGDPGGKVDLAIIAEGYTAREEEKLRLDLKRVADILFSLEPYKSRKSKFNIYGVFKPSEESGCDEPSHGIFKNTAVGGTFDSLGSERYLLTEDNQSLRDIAGAAPYDSLCIMVNHKRYGGGGIYNFFCTFTSDNQWREYLFLHEFGHSFAGLADEYYTSAVAYNEFYPKGVEPVEPNLTALLDPKNLKWKKLVSRGVEVPTPWEKEAFDLMDGDYQKVRQRVNEEIARMKREGALAAEVNKAEEESERLSQDQAKKVDVYLRNSKFWGKIGAFEGAGYSARGLYRPAVDCIMFTKGAKPFCKVCEEAVIRVIKFYSE